MMLLWLYVIASLLAIGAVADHQMRKKQRQLRQLIGAYVERLEVFTNYSKLASVRIADAKEQKATLEVEIAKIEQIIQATTTATRNLSDQGQLNLYVFDRLEGRKSRLWQCDVVSRNANYGWTGRRSYLLTGESAEEAIKRAEDRFSRDAGFQVSFVAERPL